MKLKEQYGSVALVAGASEGLGAAYTHALAQEGFELILVARREEPLQKMAIEIREKYGVKVTCIPCDLSETDALEKILYLLSSTEINFLVYNAVLPFIGPFLQLHSDGQMKMATTNMIT